MERYYYHVTTPQIAWKIMRYGLKANEDGEIFTFTPNSKLYWRIFLPTDGFNARLTTVAREIFVNQVMFNHLDENLFQDGLYSIIRISSKGIEKEPEKDICGEITSPFQWIIKQTPDFVIASP